MRGRVARGRYTLCRRVKRRAGGKDLLLAPPKSLASIDLLHLLQLLLCPRLPELIQLAQRLQPAGDVVRQQRLVLVVLVLDAPNALREARHLLRLWYHGRRARLLLGLCVPCILAVDADARLWLGLGSGSGLGLGLGFGFGLGLGLGLGLGIGVGVGLECLHLEDESEPEP